MRPTVLSRRPARCLAILLAAACLALPACGEGDGGNGREVSPALAAALAYLPRDPGIAAVISTDFDRAPVKRLEQRASKLEGWRDLEKEFKRQLAEDLDFERDVRPQLGNPLVLSASSLDQNDDLEFSALQIKDPKGMRRLLERSVARGQEESLAGYKGAIITRDLKKGPGEKDETGETFTALHRDVAVQANTKAQLEAAIDRSEGSDNLAANGKIASELGKSGEDVLFRVAGDTASLLDAGNDRETESARKVKWVRALGDFTAAGFVTNDGVRFEFEQKTDREGLSEDDLPLANGPDPALLHDQDAPIVIGIREPDWLYSFIEDAFEATDPRQFAEYEAAIRQLGALGTDIHRDVLQKVSNLSLALNSEREGSFQTDLSEGAGEDLRKFLDVSGPFLEGALGASAAGRVQVQATGSGESKVWTVRQSSGAPVLRYAVRGNALVGSLGRAPLQDPAEGTPLPKAEGALALSLSGRRLVDLVREIDQQGTPELRDASGRQALRLLSTLGSMRFSLRAETSALTGRGEFLLPRAR